MVTFRNNNNGRRNNFRRNDRNFKSNGERSKFGSNFSKNDNFQRKSPGKNNHNAPKLIEKYNDLAREALSNGDKILSENYFQHADHFTRILTEQELQKKTRFTEDKPKASEQEVGTNKEADSFYFNAFDYLSPIRASIKKFDLSGHADREALVDYAVQAKPKNIILTHGENEARNWFLDTLNQDLGDTHIIDPVPGQTYNL